MTVFAPPPPAFSQIFLVDKGKRRINNGEGCGLFRFNLLGETGQHRLPMGSLAHPVSLDTGPVKTVIRLPT